jgi:hypothetical protein
MALFKNRKKMSLALGLLGLVVLVAFGLSQQANDKEPPGKAGVPKPWTGTQSTMVSTRPYVGPQVSLGDGIRESSGQSFLRPPTPASTGNPEGPRNVAAQAGRSFGKDTLATQWTLPEWASDNSYALAMTSHSNGRLYIAYERTSVGWNGEVYIRIDYSEDCGLTWKDAGFAISSNYHFRNPSIAVTNSHIIIAYEAWEFGAAQPFIQISTAPLLNTGSAFTHHSILYHYSQDYGRNPHIWTDLHSYPTSSSVYLVYEWLVDAAGTNINVDFQRSGDDGFTWKDHRVLWGDTDLNYHLRPHGCWADATAHYLYVVHYDDTDNTIEMRKSTDWGVTFNAEPGQTLATITNEPGYDGVAPVIAASTVNGLQGVWVSFAQGDGTGDEDIYYLVSSDRGVSFYGPAVNIAQSTANEFRPLIVADPEGVYLHIVWTNQNWEVWYVTVSNDFAFWRLGYSDGIKVNRGGLASAARPDKGIATAWNFGFAGISWLDYDYEPNSNYVPFYNRHVPDDLVGTWDGQGVYYRTDGGSWIYLASPANLVAAGNLDGAFDVFWGDGTPDLVGDWTGSGLYARNSNGGAWTYIGTSPVDLAVGDMDGGGYEEILATWNGQGVYYKTSISGGWVNMATPATMVAAGDLDGDGVDDLIGVWPAQAGVYVKYSTGGTWAYIGSAPRHITTGDMDGDGRDDLVGTWDGQGVYWRKSQTGVWTLLGSPATLVTTADMDGDGRDDIVGIWPSQAGVWTKYSSTNQWEYIGSSLRDMSSAPMRSGPTTWGAQSAGEVLFEPKGGTAKNDYPVASEDYSANSPGKPGFTCLSQPNLVPVHDPNYPLVPGPGMAGFTFERTPNPVPVASPKRGEDGQGKIK